MNFEILEYKVDSLVNELLDNMKEVKAKDLGLDPRAGYQLFVGEDCIAVKTKYAGTLDYYGGFEYVDGESKREIGNWRFYTGDDDRVFGCIRHYMNNLED